MNNLAALKKPAGFFLCLFPLCQQPFYRLMFYLQAAAENSIKEFTESQGIVKEYTACGVMWI
jgi:hypothetical protein